MGPNNPTYLNLNIFYDFCYVSSSNNFLNVFLFSVIILQLNSRQIAKFKNKS